MNKIITDKEFEIVDQKTILIKLKLDIYNLKDEFEASIEGRIINGNASIDADSDVRRTFALTLIPDKSSKTFVNNQAYIWIDKLVRVSIGIIDEHTQEVYWWKFGKFVFTNTNTTYDATTNQLTINCSDLMSTLDGSKNGELGQLSIVYPAYKEFVEDAEDIFYSTDITYNSSSNTYTLKLDNYNVYGLSDYFVTTIPATNRSNPKFRINSLNSIPIVDKDTRKELPAGTLQANRFYAFFMDTGKLVLCSDGALDEQASRDYTAINKAVYSCKTNESIPHYTLNKSGSPRVNDIMFLRSDSLQSDGNYVLPRIPLIKIDTPTKKDIICPVLYHNYGASTAYADSFYLYPCEAAFPPKTKYNVPFFNNLFPFKSPDGNLKGKGKGVKWDQYARIYLSTSPLRTYYDPLIYFIDADVACLSLIGVERQEQEGTKSLGNRQKETITYIDDYTYQREYTKKNAEGKVTKKQIDIRTSDLYKIDIDYIRSFDMVAVIAIPDIVLEDGASRLDYNIYGFHYTSQDQIKGLPNFWEGTVDNEIISRNEYKINVNNLTTLKANDSFTAVIDKSFKYVDDWYTAGIPFKQDSAPVGKNSSGVIRNNWYQGTGTIPQRFPYSDRKIEENAFYIDSTYNSPIELTVNDKYHLRIVNESMQALTPEDFPDEEKVYTFMVDKRKQYAIRVPQIIERPLVPYGTPLNYYTIRNAILTTVGQLAHIKRDTCEVDDVGEYRAMPEYNEDYKQYRIDNPLWDNIPYDLEFSHGDTVLAILQKLRDLYPNYETYFDENGTFCTNMIPSNNEDEILIPEKYFYNNIISENTSVDLTTVRNVCHTWGQCLDADYYCDNGIYYDGSNNNIKYVDIYDLSNNTEYTKVMVSCFDAGTNTYTCTTKDKRIDDFFNGLAYEVKPNYCLYTTLPKVSDGTPKYIKYNYTYNSNGSIKEVTEEQYLPTDTTIFNTIPVFKIVWEDAEEEAPEYPTLKITRNPGVLKENQNYEFLLHKEDYYKHHTEYTSSITSQVTLSTSYYFSDDAVSPVFPYATYEIREVTPIRFYNTSNGLNAEIPGYEDYMTGDIIAIKIADGFNRTNESLSLTINNLEPINIYDENTYKPIEAGIIKPNITYCFKIKKKRENGADVVGAYLLGSWQVQGIAALVDSPYGDENQPYVTTGGVTVNKYSKEYFQEIYACSSVSLVVIPDSPFTCQKIGEVMSVYIDETNLTSDALAVSRAEYEIYLKARLIDSVSVTTKLAPFADVNYKVGYRRCDNKEFKPYIIKNISHDLSGGTTTWQLMNFYPLYKDDSNVGKEFTVTVYRDDEDHINNAYTLNGAIKQPGETVTLIAEPKFGYHLDDWEVISGGVEIVDNEFTMPRRNVKIKALSAPNKVEITYDANGGSPDPDSEIIVYGDRTSLNGGTNMEYLDSEFLGWSEDAMDTLPLWPVDTLDAEAFGYADYDEYNYQTLYAIWKEYAGLYETGTDNLLIPWRDLVSSGTVTVDNGVITAASFDTDEEIGDLVISRTITSIGNSAFKNNNGSKLTGVNIPSTVTYINMYAFENCANIENVILPDELTLEYPEEYFRGYVFKDCTSLKNINIPVGVAKINSYDFQNCESLEEIEIPDSIIEIGSYAFSHTALTSLETSASYILEHSFDCTDLTEITLYNPIRLHGFRQLTTRPESYEKRMFHDGDNAFNGAYNLQTCNLLVSVNSSIFHPLSSIASFGYGSNGGNISNVNFLEGTIYVPANIFNYSENTLPEVSVMEVTFPTTLHTIGENAFESANIQEVDFSGCDNLNILDEAFMNCTDLTVIDGLDSVEYIGDFAFSGCSGPTSITIPGNVDRIDEGAFINCSNLTSFVIEEGTRYINEATGYGLGILGYDDNISFVQIPESLVQPIEESGVIVDYEPVCLFGTDRDSNGFPLLKTAGPIGGGYNVEFAFNTIIPNCVFKGLEYLLEINLPNTITRIGDYAFSCCYRLPSINISNNVTYIGEHAFESCGSFVSITIPQNITVINDATFGSCSNLTTITLPSGITQIGDSAFSGCTSLSDIYFGGTASQWNSIPKGSHWKYLVPNTAVVHCLGGGGDIPI